MSFPEFKEDIISEYENYKDETEGLNLEDFDWEDYTPRHSGYIPEWAATQHLAEEEAEFVYSYLAKPRKS